MQSNQGISLIFLYYEIELPYTCIRYTIKAVVGCWMAGDLNPHILECSSGYNLLGKIIGIGFRNRNRVFDMC